MFEELALRIQDAHRHIAAVRDEISHTVVGQKPLVDRLFIGLLSRGHILIEGVPGLAKTTLVKVLASTLKADFRRIQFTPDLLPADIIGTEIYEPKTGEFRVRTGPVFHNIILADEINRAPSKVQSALLEAMQEHTCTIGGTTFKLPNPFLVLATENPIEHEGTYPLPEAQVDRFMLKVLVGYPSREEEKEVVRRSLSEQPTPRALLTPEQLLSMQDLVNQIYIDDKLLSYIVEIVYATREPKTIVPEVADYVQYGASPRASIYLAAAARAHAFLQGRAYATPLDVKSIAADVLRHRVLLSYEAEAEDITSDQVIERIFDAIPVP